MAALRADPAGLSRRNPGDKGKYAKTPTRGRGTQSRARMNPPGRGFRLRAVFVQDPVDEGPRALVNMCRNKLPLAEMHDNREGERRCPTMSWPTPDDRGEQWTHKGRRLRHNNARKARRIQGATASDKRAYAATVRGDSAARGLFGQRGGGMHGRARQRAEPGGMGALPQRKAAQRAALRQTWPNRTSRYKAIEKPTISAELRNCGWDNHGLGGVADIAHLAISLEFPAAYRLVTAFVLLLSSMGRARLLHPGAGGPAHWPGCRRRVSLATETCTIVGYVNDPPARFSHLCVVVGGRAMQSPRHGCEGQ